MFAVRRDTGTCVEHAERQVLIIIISADMAFFAGWRLIKKEKRVQWCRSIQTRQA